MPKGKRPNTIYNSINTISNTTANNNNLPALLYPIVHLLKDPKVNITYQGDIK